MRLLASTALTATLLASTAAFAFDNTVKIGVLTDTSSVFADYTGTGSIEIAKMAAEDFSKDHPDLKIEIVSADHQNKPDVAVSIARQWFDTDGVDMITDLSNSAVALAVAGVAREKNKVALVTASAAMALTNDQCSPNTVNWTYDNYSLANATGKAIIESGKKDWFFVTADFAFGKDLEAVSRAMLDKLGGTVSGSVKYPLGNPDFSSYILQAQASGAKVIAANSGGADVTNFIKQSKEFGLSDGGQDVIALGVTDVDVHNLGLDIAQGLFMTTMFNRDRDDATKAWVKRFAERHANGKPPTMMQAGVYGATLHYLKSVLEAKSDSGTDVVAAMKKLPTDDILFGKGHIRQDGRTIHDAYIWQVKKPSESSGQWDYLHLISTIPGDEAFQPLSESTCSLLKN